MKILKFWAVSLLAVVPVVAAAEQVAEVSYDPSPLGIYNQLKIKDSLTVRPALNVNELRLGSFDEPSENSNRVVIATQRDANGNIHLSDVKIKKLDDAAGVPPTKLIFPQATLFTSRVFVRNGGLLNADAGYSRVGLASPIIINATIPVYADTVSWRGQSAPTGTIPIPSIQGAFCANKCTGSGFNGGLVGKKTAGGYDTDDLTSGSHIKLDGVRIPDLPAPCTNPVFRSAVNGSTTFLLLRCN